MSTCPTCQHMVERRIRLFGPVTSVNDLVTTLQAHGLVASDAGPGPADTRQLAADENQPPISARSGGLAGGVVARDVCLDGMDDGKGGGGATGEIWSVYGREIGNGGGAVRGGPMEVMWHDDQAYYSHVCCDGDTVHNISILRGRDVNELLQLNRPRYAGLSRNSPLKKDTVILIPQRAKAPQNDIVAAPALLKKERVVRLSPNHTGMGVVAYFIGRKGVKGWYDATLSHVDEDADEYVVVWYVAKSQRVIISTYFDLHILITIRNLFVLLPFDIKLPNILGQW